MTASDILGGLSLTCWLFAQAPQIVTNWSRSSVDGIAPVFLLTWFVGDATNLVGCILTNQLPFQTALASYFIFIDCILLGQWIHYSRQPPARQHKHRHLGRYRDASVLPPIHHDDPLASSWMSRSLPASSGRLPNGDPMLASFHSEIISPSDRTRSLSAGRSRQPTAERGRPGSIVTDEATLRATRSPSVARRSTSILFFGITALLGYGVLAPRQISSEIASAAWLEGPPVVDAAIEVDWERLIGRAAAWTCAVCYLCSRMPQIWRNWSRKSVEGLSPLLFIAAFSGNLLYSLSILLSPNVQTDENFLAESVPYLLGSGGTLCLDLTIMTQIVIYRRRRARRRLERRLKRQATGAMTSSSADEAALLTQSMSEDEETYRPSRSRSIVRKPSTIVEELAGSPLPPPPPKTPA